MRKHILSIWALACLLAYCGGTETNEDVTNKKTQDEHESLVFPMRVNGPAGYLYVDMKGDGATPVVFAHSFGGSAEQWKNQTGYFEKARKVVTFDFRAHGRSDSAATPAYSPKQMAEDIEAVAEIMKLDKFILVGHSMGGSAAIAYAAEHPEKVAGLVLVGTPGKSTAAESQKIMASLRSPKYQKVMDGYMERLLQNAKPEVKAMVLQEFYKMSQPVTLAITNHIFEFDPLPQLEKYKGPLLVVQTESENKQPMALSKQMKNKASTVVIKNASHWAQLDQPEAFNQALDRFFKENDL